ncbi:MAG TPA: transposase [Bryobacteraceae bacterium]|nr:transposase [Bryobacteraceae bacterium]
MDRLLDQAREGPVYLRRPEIAEMVIQALIAGDLQFGRYELHAFVVMSNHVHLLVTSLVPATDWLRSLKGFTGFRACRMPGLRGVPFWQDESYDRLVRDDEESGRIRRYIEWNPVKAGICQIPEEFPWSSAAPGGSPAAGQKP